MYIQMTEEEVRRDVRLAKSPAAQVEILSQINGVPAKAIRRVLDGASWGEAVDNVKVNVTRKDVGLPRREAERKHHNWTRAELLRIKELRERGLLNKQIADELKVTRAIKSIVQSHPKMFPRKQRRSSISEADLERAFECRAQGMTYKEIGELIGVAGTTLRAAMIAAEKRKAAHDVPAS